MIAAVIFFGTWLGTMLAAHLAFFVWLQWKLAGCHDQEAAQRWWAEGEDLMAQGSALISFWLGLAVAIVTTTLSVLYA
jgi:tetrahydromethanopterin S-methyltransferase subunit B